MKHVLVISLLICAALPALAGPFGSRHVESEHLAGATAESIRTLADHEMEVLLAEVRLATLKLELGPKKAEVKRTHTDVQFDRGDFKKAERALKVATAAGDESGRRQAQAQVDRYLAAMAATQRQREWLQSEVALHEARIEAAKTELEVILLHRDRARAEIIETQQLRHASLHPVRKYDLRIPKAQAEHEFALSALDQARNITAEVRASYESMVPGAGAEGKAAPRDVVGEEAPAQQGAPASTAEPGEG
ncbi:hypothetical protein ABI59_04420 [Acidobacteria bacterium Mor1]|nr:hypothetical protein ABI59_04420 [Acidobacteria bacterium Mor1]